MIKRKPIDLKAVREARRKLEQLAKQDPAQFSPTQLRRLKRALRQDEAKSSEGREVLSRTLVVRCSPELLKRLDIHAAAHSVPGEARYSRGDAARHLIDAGLDRDESKRK